MKRVLFYLFLLVTFPLAASAAELQRFNQLYAELVKTHWRPMATIHGIETTVFDYAVMKEESGALIDEIASVLEGIDPGAMNEGDMAKAFWINAYNFAAMRMVVDAYPVDSITSFKISLIKHPWSKKSLRIGRQRFSLAQIEKEILLPRFGDRRIIFAVSCAAVSCPDRQPQIFDAENLDAQLDDLLRRYFRNTGKGMALEEEPNRLILAWILRKDGHLFSDDSSELVAFVSSYLPDEEREWLQVNKYEIGYFKHDWTLNDYAQRDR